VLVKRVLRILDSNHKQLTPIHLLSIDQGASILLTWVINFIKWNTGCTKYTFGNKNAEGASVHGGMLEQLEGSITNNDDFKSHQAPGKS
jgi:hypothetical protein